MNPINQNQESTLDGLAFLSGTAIKFASSGISNSIYKIIGESLRELNPNAIIIVNSIDSEQQVSRTEAFFSPPNLIENIISTLGFNPTGKNYKIDSSILNLKSGFIRKFEHGIHELSFKTIPKVVSKSIERIISLGEIYGIAFMVGEKMYANAALILRKGDDLAHKETIETFVRQASVTLKRIEAEKSEEKFRSLFEYMTQGAYFQGADGRIIDVNRAALNILGLERVDFLCKKNIRDDWDIIDEHHKPLPAKDFPAEAALITGDAVYEKIVGVYNPVKKDYVWLLVNAIPQLEADSNTPVSIFVTFQDITTIRRSVHRLVDSEANARAIMESTDDVIILLDSKGVVIDSNQAHANRLNIKRENLLGKNVFDFLPKEVGQTRRKKIEEAIRTGKPIVSEDFRAGYWNELSIHPIVSHNGKIDRVAVFAKNITERKRSEEQIKISYTLLRLAGETAKFGGWSVDLKKNTVLWSDIVAKIHEVEPGFSPSVEKAIEFYAPEWREKIKKLFFDCANSGISYNEEMEIVTSKGKRVWVRTSGEAVRDKSGKIIKIHGAFQDISDYKKISDALIVFEHKFKSSIDSLLDAFGMYSAIRDKNNTIIDFRIDYVNPKACELNKMRKEDQIGKGLCEILPAHRSSGLFNDYKELVETGDTIEKDTVIFEDIYGKESIKRTFEIKASKFEDGFIATWRDISRRKETEERLIESEREKSSLIYNLPGFVYKCSFDHSWTMNYMSDQCFDITGYHPKDFIDNSKLSFNDIIHPDFREFVWEKWQEAVSSKSNFKEEYKIETADGKTKWVWEQGHAIYTKDGNLDHLEGFIADVTQRREMEEALKESEANLVKLNATKDKFFSIIAHDLKSPFNSIIGIGELLNEQVIKKEYDGLEEYTSIMTESSHRAMNLLTNLLEWSRSQTGRMDFSPEYIRLSLLIDEAIDLSEFAANQKSIKISRQISDSAVVYADKAMISSVLRNLISNALKFTKINGEIELSAKIIDNMYLIQVKDNGIGIRKEDLNNLFQIDKFYSTRGTYNEGGTGLGLILCKEFVTKHGGEIWAESKEGAGSDFCFTIPRGLK
jgi:two-component system sensor histidine kinase/response regulator